MSGRGEMKRKYPSGASKQKKKRMLRRTPVVFLRTLVTQVNYPVHRRVMMRIFRKTPLKISLRIVRMMI